FPKDILENELFGHEEGAFTGSVQEKPGCFELADGGTLFLDEIGEMSPDTQVKLLRAIETRRFRRLGGEDEIHVDIRVLAATNRDVHEEVRSGSMREDLYYRLAVVEIALPPLRARGNDVHLLANEFLQQYAEEHGKDIDGFSDEALRFIESYDWPGNVRELANILDRAVILTREGRIRAEHLSIPDGSGSDGPASFETLEEVQRRH
ncbi:MAG: sigma 54-interacting transcriptional regulator, partial [Gemmatimonadota bacterium]